MEIERIEEFAITADVFSQIHALVQEAFPGYPPSRPYYKLRPQFRYLGWEHGTLAAHLAVEHRVIRVGTAPLSIFGVIDLCVAPPYQHQRRATRILQELEMLAHGVQRDAIVLFADDHRLYTTNGYQRIDTPCTWMKVDDHRTLGIAEQSLADCMMVKPIAQLPWPAGPVDMLGYLF
jgi:GNAT superfamily N-acetyltransferase